MPARSSATPCTPVADEVALVLGAARTAALGRIAGELRDLVLAYAEERRQRGLVTYQDLLVRARNLLRDHPDVQTALRAPVDLVAVDEFQDTDPLQAELALRLCAAVSGAEGEWRDLVPEPGRLCVVGDPKQSIYRFRRADIAVYSAVERTLVGADPRARGAALGQLPLRAPDHRGGQRRLRWSRRVDARRPCLPRRPGGST